MIKESVVVSNTLILKDKVECEGGSAIVASNECGQLFICCGGERKLMAMITQEQWQACQDEAKLTSCKLAEVEKMLKKYTGPEVI